MYSSFMRSNGARTERTTTVERTPAVSLSATTRAPSRISAPLTSPPSAAAGGLARSTARARRSRPSAVASDDDRRRAPTPTADADAAAAARLLLHPPTTARGSPPRAPHDVVALVVASRSPSSRLPRRARARAIAAAGARAPRADDLTTRDPPPPRDALARPRAHPAISARAAPSLPPVSPPSLATTTEALAVERRAPTASRSSRLGMPATMRSRAAAAERAEILGRTAVCPKLRVQGLTPVQR